MGNLTSAVSDCLGVGFSDTYMDSVVDAGVAAAGNLRLRFWWGLHSRAVSQRRSGQKADNVHVTAIDLPQKANNVHVTSDAGGRKQTTPM